jgi:hypothetical protein
MGERIHRLLGLVAAVVVIGGFLAWRSVRAGEKAGALAPAPSPGPQLAQLSAYATPIPDTMRLTPSSADAGVVSRDPFIMRGMPRVATATGSSNAPRQQAEETREEWKVTTTMIAGARRAALINDQLVYVGDPLPDGSKLTSVERDHVVVTDRRGTAHKVAVREGNG